MLAAIKVKFKAKYYNESAFRKFQLIRYLDDWAYQANVRQQISQPYAIEDLMKSYEEVIIDKVYEGAEHPAFNLNYVYPWNRKFEVEVKIN